MSITSQVCILPLNLAILTCTWVRHLGDGGSNGGDVTVHICVLGCSCMVLLWVVGRPATIHRDIFLPRYEYHILNKLSCNIYDTFTYASTKNGKHCLQCRAIFQTN